MALAALSLVLHAHLPYVRQAAEEDTLEERWLFEAITDCHLPLLAMLERIRREGVPCRLTVSLSPTLLEMLEDPLLQARYVRHLERLERLAADDARRLRNDARYHPLAKLYGSRFRAARRTFERLGRRLATAYAKLRDGGLLELTTTAATHAYLPLFRSCPGTIRAQMGIGGARHAEAFGSAPAGFWLPECGYFPGLEGEVAATGARYFVVESHGVLNASSRARHGTFGPLACPNGIAAFPRDPECTRLVWSAESGYPGHPDYREFHWDRGYELAPEDLGPLAPPGGGRAPTGLKYRRVTGPTNDKLPYVPAAAQARVAEHAADFLRRVTERVTRAAASMDRPPLLVAPFDAELFGHWWFEGPSWLEAVIRGAAATGVLDLVTPGDHLARHPLVQCATPAESSWGGGGAHATWLNPATDWLWPRLLAAGRRMEALAEDVAAGRTTAFGARAARQAARHLLLAQASDWPFMIAQGRTAEFAGKTLRDQLARFDYIESRMRAGRPDARRLRALEDLDPLFPRLDTALFAPEH